MELPSHTINETNSFGDRSFYVNDEPQTETVRIVTQIGSDIYAVTYERKDHFKFANLLNQLHEK